MNSTTEIVSMIAGKGTLDDDPVRYEMAARIDSRTGKFHGTYDVDGGGDLVGNGLFSRLAKRAWDLKLKWGPPVGQPASGAGPTVPQSIYELGNFDLSISDDTSGEWKGLRLLHSHWGKQACGAGRHRLS